MLVQFLAGKLCSLSLNVVFVLCIFLWSVVLFKPKRCAFFVHKILKKLYTFCVFSWEVVLSSNI